MGLVICWRKSCWGPGQLIPGDPPAECHVLAPGWVGVARALSLLTPERCFTKKILMGSGSFIFKGLNSLWLLGLWGLGWLRACGFYSGTEQEKALTQAGFHQLSRFRVRKVWARELPGTWIPLPLTPSASPLLAALNLLSTFFVPRPMLVGASCFWFDFLSVRINVYTLTPRSGSQECAQYMSPPKPCAPGSPFGSIPQPRLSPPGPSAPACVRTRWGASSDQAPSTLYPPQLSHPLLWR